MDINVGFQRYFDACRADCDVDLQDVFALRYRIYCLERGYETSADFPDGLERDQYDDHSLHGLIRVASNQAPIACVRLVLPASGEPDRQFPMERFCGHVIDPEILGRFDFEREGLAEVSRFAISRVLTRRHGESESLSGVAEFPNDDLLPDAIGRRLFPHVSLGLIAMALGMCREHNIRWVYAVMEPALDRLLCRFGIRFIQLGPVVDYHGQRQPMIAKVEDILHGIYQARPDLYRLVEALGGGLEQSPVEKQAVGVSAVA